MGVTQRRPRHPVRGLVGWEGRAGSDAAQPGPRVCARVRGGEGLNRSAAGRGRDPKGSWASCLWSDVWWVFF